MSTREELAADPPAGARAALIPTWVRILVVLIVLPVWSVAVLFSLFALHRLPDVAWMAVPSAVIVAVAPTWSRSGRGGGGR